MGTINGQLKEEEKEEKVKRLFPTRIATVV